VARFTAHKASKVLLVPLARFTTHKASKVLLVPLIFKINVLFGLPLPVLVVLVTTTRFALHHVCIRDVILWNRMRHILGFCLFLDIKRGDQIFNSHGLLLVLQAPREVLPRWRKFGNNATNHKPIRQDTIKMCMFPHQKLNFMSLFHDRSVIDHLVFVVLVINIKFMSSIKFCILVIQGIP
jgi:hypothetical protein